MLLSLLASAALAWQLLEPIARSSAAPLVTALNLAYPSLDLVLLVPAIALLWLTSRFRGGAIWRTWAALLLGFVCVAVGDILFAYFSTLGIQRLDPLVHAMYIVAYGSVAAGGMIQHKLLAA